MAINVPESFLAVSCSPCRNDECIEHDIVNDYPSRIVPRAGKLCLVNVLFNMYVEFRTLISTSLHHCSYYYCSEYLAFMKGKATSMYDLAFHVSCRRRLAGWL